jgi:alkylation response protein AidB-like acyl-CoA dehydrogenase
VATGYEVDAHGGADCRVIQMLKLHMWCASSAYVACPSAMQDGAVAVLQRELARLSSTPYAAYSSGDYIAADSRKVFARALERLTSRDPTIAWTSGQWMTERAGGSDVRGTETVATWAGASNGAVDGTDIDGNSLGPWLIDGFKWFSSATDCGMTVLLAQTAKGVACFFAPTRKLVRGQDGGQVEVMNGIRIQRLKNKLGTRALPTAELELNGMRAWLVGEEGEGVKVISTMLTVTRVYNASKWYLRFGLLQVD